MLRKPFAVAGPLLTATFGAILAGVIALAARLDSPYPAHAGGTVLTGVAQR